LLKVDIKDSLFLALSGFYDFQRAGYSCFVKDHWSCSRRNESSDAVCVLL